MLLRKKLEKSIVMIFCLNKFNELTFLTSWGSEFQQSMERCIKSEEICLVMCLFLVKNGVDSRDDSRGS